LVSGLDGTNAAILGAAAIGWENYDNKWIYLFFFLN
jgi:hypothetical protein